MDHGSRRHRAPAALTALLLPLLGAAAPPPPLPRLTPRAPALGAADFRIPVDRILPETESYQLAVFSGGVSGIPRGEVVDRIGAPPLVALLRQEIALLDHTDGRIWRSGAEERKLKPGSAPGGVWQPGKLTLTTAAGAFEIRTEQYALRQPQGFVIRYTLQNRTAVRRRVTFLSAQAPAIVKPESWGYGPHYGGIQSVDSAAGHAEKPLAVHANGRGAVAYGLSGGRAIFGASVDGVVERAFQAGSPESGGDGPASALVRDAVVPARGTVELHVVFTLAGTASEAAAATLALRDNPEGAVDAIQTLIDSEIKTLFERLPAFTHPDPRVERFYRHSAVQLLFARWRLPGKLALDPWYATLGLDSGGMNTYMWGVHYVRMALALFEPDALRAQLLAFLAAPLSEHYSIEPLHGRGVGPFYSYNPYSYITLVDCYLRVTGDRSLLREVRGGRSVLEWLMAMAEFGEKDLDKDGNRLLDYGDDHNLLEIKTTGSGPGYVHEVPSPNGERVYSYATVAQILEEEDAARYSAAISRYRAAAGELRLAMDRVLWLDGPGWYGTRQRDGTVVPVYSIQIFDLLRVPGLVPRARAERLAGHVNDAGFLGPWGIRSLSRRDRLWDWRDHDWSGPMTYIGDGPQFVADLFEAGFAAEAWRGFERILWWPEHLAIWPQGIANDDYSSRVPESVPFGGRISAGLTNEMSAATGTDAVMRGLFGVEPGRDGSLRFGACAGAGRGVSALAYPHRGRRWTATQSGAGLDVRRDDGLQAALHKPGGWLRFLPDGKTVRVEAWAGSGSGMLSAETAGLRKALHARPGQRITVSVNGQGVRADAGGERILVPLGDLAQPVTIEFAAQQPR